MRAFIADLHVHTLLSPCAAVEMTPRNIVFHALEYGIDIVAITDHNACNNVEAALKAADGLPVMIVPGMEVETKEEVHLLSLFPGLPELKDWEGFILEYRPPLFNDERRFGAQFIVDEKDELVAVKPEMLLASLTCSLAEAVGKVKELGGICIASHIDRPAYSLLSQLGFIPLDLPLTAVEVSGRTVFNKMGIDLPIVNLPVVSASDAHDIETFLRGPKLRLYMETLSFDELVKAIKGVDLRKAVVVNHW